MSDIVNKAKRFLMEKFSGHRFFKSRPDKMIYRLEHTMRVCHIGEEIASGEGFDIEQTVLGCMLHDIGYCEEIISDDDWLNHGRRSAVIAEEFLNKEGYDEIKAKEILYGIAIHVDGVSDFEGERTPLALTIGDADNIDRFDAYRIYDFLERNAFSSKPLHDKKEYVNSRISRLDELFSFELATKTAKKLWTGRIEFYRDFYYRLSDQLENSDYEFTRF
ncbi:MAG: HD domain-containing protein [Ruminococcaceae bacterium]|nr:HD domain-containing protein [Oscillospiraceae bacterium]